jgi:hypothetical protein
MWRSIAWHVFGSRLPLRCLSTLLRNGIRLKGLVIAVHSSRELAVCGLVMAPYTMRSVADSNARMARATVDPRWLQEARRIPSQLFRQKWLLSIDHEYIES